MDVLSQGIRGEKIERVAHAFPQVERRDLELNPTRFDFRIVENVIEDGQQRVP
jgi:hypothetical protein